MPAYEYTSFIIPHNRSDETKTAIDKHLAERASLEWKIDQYSMAVKTDQSFSSTSSHSVIHSFIWRKDD